VHSTLPVGYLFVRSATAEKEMKAESSRRITHSMNKSWIFYFHHRQRKKQQFHAHIRCVSPNHTISDVERAAESLMFHLTPRPAIKRDTKNNARF